MTPGGGQAGIPAEGPWCQAGLGKPSGGQAGRGPEKEGWVG